MTRRLPFTQAQVLQRAFVCGGRTTMTMEDWEAGYALEDAGLAEVGPAHGETRVLTLTLDGELRAESRVDSVHRKESGSGFQYVR